MAEEYVVGWEQFITLGARLREVGSGELAREVQQGIERGARPLPESARTSALEILPKKGHLNTAVADSRIRTERTSSGVRIIAESRYDLSAIDSGHVTHPLFGDRRHWYTEAVRPGWWSTPMQRAETLVRPEVERALEDVKRNVEGGIGG